MFLQYIFGESWGEYKTNKFYSLSLKNYYLNRSIILVSDCFNNANILEFDAKTGDPVADGPLKTFLKSPNNNQTSKELFQEFVRNLLSGGYCYLYPYHQNAAYVNFIEKGSQLLVLNNDHIDHQGQQPKFLQEEYSFMYEPIGPAKINFSQIIPFFDISQDPKNKFRGISRMQALEDELSQIYIANKAISNQIKMSGNIIVSPEATKESELSQGLDKPIIVGAQKTQKDQIEENINSSGLLRGKSFTISSTALKAINLAESLKDYDFNAKFKQEAGRVIMNLYGIPRKLQNIITTAEMKSDKEGEDVDMYEKIVIPMADNFSESINSVYSELTGTKIKLDYSHLSVFKSKLEDTDKKDSEKKNNIINNVVTLKNENLITVDEAIKILQDEKIIG